MTIDAPCDAPWDQMRPEEDGRGRHCELCSKRVHDLSAMTESEARVFLEATASYRVCISYLRRADGTPSFRAPPGPRPQAAPTIPAARLVRGRARPARDRPAPRARTALAPAMAGALAACTPHGAPEILDLDEVLAAETELEPGIAHETAQIPVADAPAPPRSDTPPSPPPEATPPAEVTPRPPVLHRTAGVRMPRVKGKRAPIEAAPAPEPDGRISGWID